MKKRVSLSAAVMLFGILFFTSCSKTDEPQPTSNSSEPRARFDGNWSVSENSKDYGPSTYNLTISDSTNSAYILIGYLYGFNKKTYATVSGNNFAISSQTIQTNTVSGSGILTNANRIDLKFTVRTTVTHYDTVTAVLNR